jgi:hypothetical protein
MHEESHSYNEWSYCYSCHNQVRIKNRYK